jgi:hypothetical protein
LPNFGSIAVLCTSQDAKARRTFFHGEAEILKNGG